MTKEEAKAYFEECNEGIIAASKDENVYDYEKQEIMDVFMRKTYEANVWAIKALSVPEREKGEWITDNIDEGYVECPFCHSLTNCEWGKYDDLHFCFNCGADMRGEAE